MGGVRLKNKIRKRKIIIISMFILGAIGLGLISYNYVLSKINLTFETVNLKLYGNNEPEEKKQTKITQDTSETPNPETIEEEPSNKIINNNYVGYLEIPKINLKQGLVSVDDVNNDVNKNIQTIYPSNWPDVKGGNLILASHSGTSSISYFKNLYQLNVNDKVNIYYNGQKYNYKIANIYEVAKNGKVAIYRDTKNTTLTLITCTKNNDTSQTVYIAYLESQDVIS